MVGSVFGAFYPLYSELWTLNSLLYLGFLSFLVSSLSTLIVRGSITTP